jgi:hypothetical protein
MNGKEQFLVRTSTDFCEGLWCSFTSRLPKTTRIMELLFFWNFPLSGILENRKHDVSETGSGPEIEINSF